jgi:predicted NUDIX family phosphoesterase
MKQALCVNSYDELSNLVHKNLEHVEAKLVDREICENPENGHQQLIPYVTLFAVNPEEGKLMFIQYQRKSEGEGDERLAGKTSIGFGGHIDCVEDIVCSETITNEDGSTSFKMSLQDIIDTGYKCAKRELQEELQLNLDELAVNISHGNTAFFTGDMSEEVNRVHLGLSIQVELDPTKFEEVKAACIINLDEIEQLDTLGVNLDIIIEEMDLTVTINKITGDLAENHGLEDWSCRIFNYIVRNVTHKLLEQVTYQDLMSIVMQKCGQTAEQPVVH